MLELLVVIFIMMLMATLAVASFRGFLDTERIKLAGGAVNSAVSLARQYAMSKRAQCMVEFVGDIYKTDDPIIPGSHTLYMTADNSYQAYLNGTSIGSGSDFNSMQSYTLNPKNGTNVIAVKANNSSAGPAGLLAELNASGVRSSPTWKARTTASSDWPNCTDGAQWTSPAFVNGIYGIAPWNARPSAPPPPAGTPAAWVWNVASTASVPGGDMYFLTTFNYVAPVTWKPPADTEPRYVRIIPYKRMLSSATGGFTWLLDQDANALKTMELPRNIQYVLTPAKIAIDQYDPGNLITHTTAAKKSFLVLAPDGTCSAAAPNVLDDPLGTKAHWATFINAVILHDITTDDVCLLYTSPATSSTRQRYLYAGTDVDYFVNQHTPYTLW